MLLLAAPDKFKGTVSAREAATAIAAGASQAGWEVRPCPLADGGEGTIEALGGANIESTVTGPLGTPLVARWRIDGELAIIEMAEASGLVRAGGVAANAPLEATTAGTGELIVDAISHGARRIIVGVGGSATTDGGLGAVQALHGKRFDELGVVVEVACDVSTTFVDAAAVFGPQKGANETEVAQLTKRLQRLARRYRHDYGVDVTDVPGTGAAGGLAGGLLALGARLEGGFDLIARMVNLQAALRGTDLVITGEGRVDQTSFTGKVVGGVARLAAKHALPVLVLAGEIAPSVGEGLVAISLVERFGRDRSVNEAASCLAVATADWLSHWRDADHHAAHEA